MVAFALVEPICGTCESPVGYTPLVDRQSRNVVLGREGKFNAGGAWCFRVLRTLAPHTYTVVTSAVGAELKPFLPPKDVSLPPGSTTVPLVRWVTSAPDCRHGQIEIRTDRYYATASGLVSEPSNEISFDFAVLG